LKRVRKGAQRLLKSGGRLSLGRGISGVWFALFTRESEGGFQMKFAAFVFAFVSVFSVAAMGNPVTIKGMKGREYADFLKRSCKPDEWKQIAPFLEKTKFAEQDFPAYEFEIGNDKITSESYGLKIDMASGKPRLSVDGHVFEGSLCEIIAGFAKQSPKVAKHRLFDLLESQAFAREKLKTEITTGDYVKWGAIAVAAGGAAVLTGGTSIFLAGAFVAAGGGAVGGDWLGQTTRTEWNRRQLEQDLINLGHLTPTACTPTTVVLKDRGGKNEVMITRGKDPDVYVKGLRYEGRLRASLSAPAKNLIRQFANCKSPRDVARLQPPKSRVETASASIAAPVAARPLVAAAPPPERRADEPLPAVEMDPGDDLKDMSTNAEAGAAAGAQAPAAASAATSQ